MSIAFKEKRHNDGISYFANSMVARDIIIVTGCNAVGKTSASCHLQKKVSPQNTSSTSKHVADSQFLLKAMQQDDQAGGFHHTHDWCMKGEKGHSHTDGKSLFPFTVLDNKLPNDMRTHFFEKLVTLPATSELWFVEWAAGINTNSSPLSEIDYSYATARKAMEETDMATHLLKRILAVVHIKADMHIRSCLNRRRSLPSSSIVEEIEHGTSFWQKDDAILQFYGHDDFCNIEDLFTTGGIPIYDIQNDGTPHFFNQHLERVGNELQKKPELVSAT